MTEQFLSTFLKKVQLTRDTYAFYFDRKDLTNDENKKITDWDFSAGQYIRMVLPHDSPDSRGTSRFFTIASSPLQKDSFILTIKIIESTFKKHLLLLKEGEKVQFWGPVGTFILPEEVKKPLVFISGGIGITPFYSMVMYAAEKKVDISITLFSSFSSIDDIVFYDELHALTKQNKNIAMIYTVTGSVLGNVWKGEIGRISEELLKRYLGELDKYTYYIAGPGQMVDAMRTLLQEHLVEESGIIQETFPGY